MTQLLSVLDDWTRAMMEGHNTDVVYFDFSNLTSVSYINSGPMALGGSF